MPTPRVRSTNLQYFSRLHRVPPHEHPRHHHHHRLHHPGAAEDSDLSMVLEKAQVLLSAREFSDFSLLLDEYRTGAIGVDQLTEELVNLIDDGTKVTKYNLL